MKGPASVEAPIWSNPVPTAWAASRSKGSPLPTTAWVAVVLAKPRCGAGNRQASALPILEALPPHSAVRTKCFLGAPTC